MRITALLDGVSVHGEPVIDDWRSRCQPYPEALARAMVEHGLDLRSQERLEMLAARDDVVLLHRDLVDGVQGVLDALFGANRVYAPHPFHKWLEWEVTLLAQLPDDPRRAHPLAPRRGAAPRPPPRWAPSCTTPSTSPRDSSPQPTSSRCGRHTACAA